MDARHRACISIQQILYFDKLLQLHLKEMQIKTDKLPPDTYLLWLSTILFLLLEDREVQRPYLFLCPLPPAQL